MAESFVAAVGAFLFFVIVLLIMGVRQVPQGWAYTVERFGHYRKTMSRAYAHRAGYGPHRPQDEHDGTGARRADPGGHHQGQRDRLRRWRVFFQVLDAARASYEVARLENSAAEPDHDQHPYCHGLDGSRFMLLSHRDEINTQLLRVVDQAVQPWGIKMNRIEIKDIVPPRDLVEAMGRQMKAEREKRANILDAEGHRAAEILRAEGRKQALILDAEGRKESAFRDAEARERQAEAEAAATKIVSEAIATGDIAAINYFVAEKYVRAIDSLAKSPNQKTFIMPMDMAGIAGTLGGIAEVARAALGQDDERGGNRGYGSRSSVPPAGRGNQ